MPPVVIAAGIGAAGALGGAALASRASNKATEASSKANTEALAYTKEQEAARRAEYDKATAAYQQQWNAWNAQRMALLQRYGVDVSGMQQPQMQQPATATATTAAVPAAGAPTNFMQRMLGPGGMNQIRAAAQGGQTVADILGRGSAPGDWNDWKAQGLPSA